MDFFLIYLPAFLGLLTILVFVHELGHYAVARLCGVRVEVFSIGFGRELFGWTDRAGTRWKFSALPFGGYVKMFGEGMHTGGGASGQPASREEASVAFGGKSLARRTAIIFAGPAANLVFALLVLMVLFMTKGQVDRTPMVSAIVPGGAAESAGILPGDRFLRINGGAIDSWRDMARIVSGNPGDALTIVVLRDGRRVSLVATPRIKDVLDRAGQPQQIGFLGVRSGPGKWQRLGPADAFWEAGRESVAIARFTLSAVGQMVTGKREVKELGGPLRIGQMSGDHARRGWVSFAILMALLSINLGLINLFPIPMLDGGHLLFYGIEAVRGKPLGEKAQMVGVRIGLVLVLGLMVFVTINDLVNLSVFEFVKKLIT